MDRYNVDPLIVKKDTVRDGDALAQQAEDGQFAIFMYIVAVVSLSAFLWMLVMYRKMKYGEEDEFEADQTDVVAEEMVAKAVPEINTSAVAPIPAPLPAPVPAPALLHRNLQPPVVQPDRVVSLRYHQQVFLKVGHKNSGIILVGNTSMVSQRKGRVDQCQQRIRW